MKIDEGIAKRQDLADKKVYLLTGADVLCVLEDRGLIEKFSTEEIEELVDYIDRKLEIPWMEYIEVMVDLFMDRKKGRK